MPVPPPRDDPTISNDEILYRRIFPSRDALQHRENGPGFRPASGSMRSTESPLSVDLGSLTTPEQTRDRGLPQQFHVARFSVQVVREAGCGIVPDPLPNNPAHALVYGTRAGDLLTNGEARAIARRAEVILVVEGTPPPE